MILKIIFIHLSFCTSVFCLEKTAPQLATSPLLQYKHDSSVFLNPTAIAQFFLKKFDASVSTKDIHAIKNSFVTATGNQVSAPVALYSLCYQFNDIGKKLQKLCDDLIQEHPHERSKILAQLEQVTQRYSDILNTFFFELKNTKLQAGEDTSDTEQQLENIKKLKNDINSYLQNAKKQTSSTPPPSSGPAKTGQSSGTPPTQSNPTNDSIAITNNKTMLLFINDDEIKDAENIGSVSEQVIVSLYQQAGPFIVSTALIKNIFQPTSKSHLAAFNLEKNFYTFTKNTKLYSIQSALNFDSSTNKWSQESNWIIKEITGGFLLFIPTSYLKSLGITDSEVDQQSLDASSVTRIELQLGIKVNHLITIDLNTVLAAKSYSSVIDFFNQMKNDAIFVPKPFYYQKTTSTTIRQPLWSLYMLGHGEYTQSVAGLPLSAFKEMLIFFASHLNTRLLYVISCYSGGITQEKIFDQKSTFEAKEYPFIIITGASGNSPTSLPSISVKALNAIRLEINAKTDYIELQKVISADQIDYDALLNAMFAGQPRDWGNLLQIRLPGTSWFSLAESKKVIVSIGKILAATHQKDKPLNITQFNAGHSPIALLLYSNQTPFELQIDKELEVIISMIPNDADIYIKKISSSESSTDVIQKFMHLPMLEQSKSIFIDAINNDLTDIIIRYEHEKNKSGETYTIKAFYKKSGDPSAIYVYESNSAEKLADKGEIWQHERLTIKKVFFQDQPLTPEQVKKLEQAVKSGPKTPPTTTAGNNSPKVDQEKIMRSIYDKLTFLVSSLKSLKISLSKK